MGEGEWNGAGDGIRTRDINLGKVALYQLSYSRSRAKLQYPAPVTGVSNGVAARGNRLPGISGLRVFQNKNTTLWTSF